MPYARLGRFRHEEYTGPGMRSRRELSSLTLSHALSFTLTEADQAKEDKVEDSVRDEMEA